MSSKKNTILIFSNHFLPGYKAGGPIKSIKALCDNTSDLFKFVICTLNKDHTDTKPYENIKTNQLICYKNYTVIYFNQFTLFNILKKFKVLNPNLIYLNSFFSNYTTYVILLKYFHLIHCPIILSTRGELSSGALSIKRNKKWIFLTFSKLLGLYNKVIFHATDANEKKAIQQHFKQRCCVIPNLISGDIHSAVTEKSPGMLRIVFFSRISEKKNLLYALNVLASLNTEARIAFDIYGPIEEHSYWALCTNVINRMPSQIKVTYKSSIHPNDVIKVLSTYHMFFLPTRNENFGHAIVEAMQAGLILLLSDQTPWTKLQDHGAGWSLPLDNPAGFVNAITQACSFNQDQFNQKITFVRNYYYENFNNAASSSAYVNFFTNIINTV